MFGVSIFLPSQFSELELQCVITTLTFPQGYPKKNRKEHKQKTTDDRKSKIQGPEDSKNKKLQSNVQDKQLSGAPQKDFRQKGHVCTDKPSSRGTM